MVVVLALAGFFYSRQSAVNPEVSVMPTPAEDNLATNELGNEMIWLQEPLDGETVSSPLVVRGQARGGWFFEANFPVILTDWDGLIIAEGFATAEGEWMTEEFVPFSAEITFVRPEYGDRGSLILQKANPSGLSEHDDALEIVVRFEEL